MPNTSVHLPGEILEELDELAARRGISRNRLIVEGCLEILEQSRGWPEGFFDPDRYSPEDLALLRSGREEFEDEIARARRNLSEPPF